MARKKVTIRFSDLKKSIFYAYESATGDELPEEVSDEMAEFLIDDLGLGTIVEYDEEESSEPAEVDDEDF